MADQPVTRVNRVTSIDMPWAVVGRALRRLFTLLEICFANLSLRSGAWRYQKKS